MGSVNHQVGYAEETTYGTRATPSRWVEIVSESMQRQTENIVSQGMAPGRRFPLARQVVQTRQWAEGDIETEVATTGMGLFFKHMLGTDSPTTTPVGTLAFNHEFILGNMTDSLTIQKGVQRVDDPTIVEPFTLVGTMVTGWSMSIAVDEILGLTLNLDARDMLDADNDSEVLETAAYPDVKVFYFAQGTVLLDDVPVALVSAADISATWNLTTDRYHLGSTGRKAQPRNVFGDEITGTFTADFGDPADFIDAHHDNTTLSVELEFLGDDIEPGVSAEQLGVTLGAVKLGNSPIPLISTDLVTVDVPFSAYKPDAGEVITISYTTTDPTP